MLAVEVEARGRDFHDQHGMGGMRGRIVAGGAADDRDVGLGLRGVVERDRRLRADVPALAERAREHTLDQPDRGVVGRALRLRHQQEPVDQLETIAGLEHAPVDEALVLHTLPPLHLECLSGHQRPLGESSDPRRRPSTSPGGDIAAPRPKHDGRSGPARPRVRDPAARPARSGGRAVAPARARARAS